MRHDGLPRLFSRQAMDGTGNNSKSDNGCVQNSTKSRDMQFSYGDFKEVSKTTFTEQKGCFLSWWRIGLLAVCTLGALVLVGLLVGYMATCDKDTTQLTRISAQRQTASERSQGGDWPFDGEPDLLGKSRNPTRLPQTFQPLHYKLVVQPHLPPENFTLDGHVSITVKCKEETTDIILHATEMEILSVNVTEGMSTYLPVSATFRDEPKQFVIIHMEDYLKPNRTYRISMDYRGEVNNQSAGMYRTSYVDEKGEKQWMATSQLQPTDARRMFPCFDEPEFKATFEVSVIRKKDVVSVSNMPIWKTQQWDDEWELDLYNTTVPMSTYLLAFVIGKIAPYKKDDNSQFQIWGRPSAVHLGEYAYSIGPKLLTFYENLFGIPYPLPKMDMVAVPEIPFAGMENWGLIIFQESALFCDLKKSSHEDVIFITVVTAHELAHQWFGNLITAAWWDDLWLHEGFATYIEYIGSAAVQPDWGMDQMFLLDVYEVLETDSLVTSHAISAAVEAEPDEIMELFDEVSYLKGGTIIRMMEHFLGSENFWKGLKEFLKNHAFKSATRGDLWKYLNETSDLIDVKKVMDGWTMQNGYPVVSVKRSYETNSATISQKVFMFESDESNAIDSARSNKYWEIPVTYTEGSNPEWTTESDLWLSKESVNLTGLNSADTWVILNSQQVGYYRVNYDRRNWDLIIQQLVRDAEVIHVMNRGQIMNDALNLARSDHLPYALALNMTVYLLQEKDFLPWKSTLIAFRYMERMLAKTEAYGAWKEFNLLLMKPAYESLSWTPDESQESMLKRLLRTDILRWTCMYGGEDCVETALRIFKQWKQSPREQQIVSPDVLGVALCTGIAHGNRKDWDFVWDRFLKEDLMTEKNRLLKSLACTREPWLLERLLSWILKLDSELKAQDASTVFEAVADNVYARDIAYSFLRKNWHELFNLYGSSVMEMAQIVEYATSSLNSDYELQELRGFLNRRNADHLGTATNAFRRSLERASANVRWIRKNLDTVSEWLQTQTAQISPLADPLLHKQR